MDEQERLKLSAVFTYLKELANLRYSGRLDLDRENHINFSDFQPIGKGVRLWTPDSSKQNLLIQIEFLRRPDAPKVPNEVKDCINESKLSYREKPEIDYHCFEDSQKAEAIDKWLKDFHHWQKEMQHVRKVQEYYNKILSLYLTLSNTGYQKELVLGSMIFEAASNQAERIKYPLLTRRLTILKSVSVQENAVISIYLDEETQTEINPVPVAVCGLNSSPVTELQQAIKDLEINPLATEDIGLDKQFSELPAKISQNCRWAENSEKKRFSEDTQYVIYKDPVLLLRNKNTGLCETLDKVLADLQNGIADIPLSLKNIVCGGQGKKELDFEEPSMESKIAETAGEDEEILMVKPANREQLQVARAVKSNPAVVVQGPPGTGKTHTIANLLAHFLSEGKKVLVTSSSPNALSVLKDKLPESLQSLCVSATGDGKDMEKSITSLVNELAQSNRQMPYLHRNVESLKQSRKKVIERLKNVRKDIYSLRKREKEGEDSGVTYFKGKKYSINGLARELYKTESLSTLIPGQVKTEDFPLTQEELTELYSTNGRWSEIDADYFREKEPLKNLDDVLLDSQQFELMVNGLLRLNDWLAKSQIKAEKIFSSGKFQISFSNAVSEKNLLVCPEENCEELPKVWSGISLAELKQIAETPFLLFAVDAGRRNGADKEALEIFIKDLKILDQLRNLVKSDIRVSISIPEEINHSELKNVLDWLKSLCRAGKANLGLFNKIGHKKDLELYNSIKITGIDYLAEAAIDAVTNVLRLQKQEKTIQIEAEHLTNASQVDVIAYLNERKDAGRVCSDLETALIYWNDTCLKLYQSLLEKQVIIYASNDTQQGTAELVHFFNDCCFPVAEYLGKIKEKKIIIAKLDILKTALSSSLKSEVLVSLREAIHSQNPEMYKKALSLKQEKDNDAENFLHREALLNKLKLSAPEWADSLQECQTSTFPPQIYEAWDWKRKELLFESLQTLDANKLTKEASILSKKLRELTTDLVENEAWLQVQQRLQNSEELRHLSYVALQFKKLGKGTGKSSNIERIRAEIRKELPKCQLAVPIWIMPISNVLASFQGQTKFDVLIVDEASQSDVSTLPVLLLARKAIIVGDDQQVSPISFEGDQKVQSLVDAHLDNTIDRKNLYLPETSLYDICQNTYKTIMLLEHFRCVPSIISYSNELCYKGKIRPLRDASTTNLLPPLIDWPVDGHAENDHKNVIEARAIINLIKACLKQKEYENKSIGIIPMVSGSASAQVKLISQMIESDLPAEQVKKHNIRCGLSSAFQGDERDVIFLSLVDSLKDGDAMLTLKAEGKADIFKKRYNVAVSRAKDQLWVVHSIDWRKELKPNDLRYRLLAHISAENIGKRTEQSMRDKSESEFEMQVAQALNARGYSFEQQYKVGGYRLDFAVCYGDKKVALECDGDKYHSSQDQILSDMQRQCVLERNRWRFVRLSGSEYFRDPGKAIDRVCRELAEMGIHPCTEKTHESDLLGRIRAFMSDVNEKDCPYEDSIETMNLNCSENNEPEQDTKTTFPNQFVRDSKQLIDVPCEKEQVQELGENSVLKNSLNLSINQLKKENNGINKKEDRKEQKEASSAANDLQSARRPDVTNFEDLLKALNK